MQLCRRPTIRQKVSCRIMRKPIGFKKILAFTIPIMILLGTFAVLPRVEAQVCNLTNVRTQYPAAVHVTQTFQVLVDFTVRCDYSGRIVLRVNLVDERTGQLLSKASWTWYQNYGTPGTTETPWLQLGATAPDTAGYWPLVLYAFNVDGEGTASTIPFQIQVL